MTDQKGTSYIDEIISSFKSNTLPQEITNRFNVLELLAHNDFGETYLLSEKGSGRLFVLKSLRRYELYSETEILHGLEHKGLPKFETQIESGETIYTLREYIDGQTLENWFDENPAVNEDMAVRILSDLCDILDLLHSQPTPIIHRDIKPSNIIIDPVSHSITLIDFGVSRMCSEEAERDTVCVATRGFAAPEQFGFAQTDARSDIYALGKLLGFMLTGTVKHNRLVGNKVLEHAINKCTALDPKNRFQSAGELKKHLKDIERISG